MKKFLQSVSLAMGLLVAGSANAQLANGALMPAGLVLTDINGNTHDLDALLSQGKALFIDVSATWCGPCWGFHQTGILEELYATYGPDGTDEVRVFFIEGDGQTTIDQLNGIGTGTQGNWVAGTPYPIVDDAAAGDALSVGFFPTLYMICPSRRVWHISPSEVLAYWPSSLHIANARACNNPIDAVMNGYTGETSTCGSLSPLKVQIQNKGVEALTSATITATLGGTQVATTNWTGTLQQFQATEVSFGSADITSSSDLVFTVTPTGTDVAPTDNTFTQAIDMAPTISTTDVIVKITTDRYGSETTWRIRRPNNSILASGGPYADMAANGVTVQPEETVTLPANGCYKFEILDSYSDGICCAYGEGSYEVTDANGVSLVSGGEFGATEKRALIGEGASSIDDNQSVVSDFTVYPNPSNGLVNISMNLTSNDDVTLKVYNSIGALVHENDLGRLTVGSYFYPLNLSGYAAGMYRVVAVSSKGVSVNSVQISR